MKYFFDRFRDLRIRCLVPVLSLALTACGGGSNSALPGSVSLGNETPLVPAAEPVANAAPSVSGSPALSVQAGDSYRFRPHVHDPEDDTLVFSIRNRPAWARFNAATGALVGQPTNADTGVWPDISIAVSDGVNVINLAPFSITVTARVVSAPTVPVAPPAPVPAPAPSEPPPAPVPAPAPSEPPPAPAPAPAPSEPPPAPAPAPAPSEPPPAPAPAPAPAPSEPPPAPAPAPAPSEPPPPDPAPVPPPPTTGSVSLSWQPPSQRADGSGLALSEISRYRIYYGTAPGSYDFSLDVTGAQTTSRTITDLPVGDWYFVVTAVDVDNLESRYSNEASRTVR